VTEPESVAMAPVQHMLWLVVLFVSALLLVVAAATFGTVVDTNEIRRKDEKLHEKSVEMERFAYTVSHDLKSPVVTIKTFAGFVAQDIEQGVSAEKTNNDLSYVRNAADRMSRLLDELLHMSRIGHQEKPPTQSDFHVLAQEAINAVGGQITERGVKVFLGQGDVSVSGDSSRLVELWQNLLENAVKYMGEQPLPEIAMGIERYGRDIVFFVRDNGIGIDARFHKKIFDVFEKLDSDSEGAGLGLAVVKRIVEIYHGSIWVESPGIGRGSTFRFTLPDATRV